MPETERRVLLTGATGYIGGRLLPRLLADGHRVRCMVRSLERAPRLDAGRMDLCEGDVMDVASITAALSGVEAAYYLVHSMGRYAGFEERDRLGALNFAHAATRAGVRRIVYLGGLGDENDPSLSRHLRSRQEVGRLLRESDAEVIEFRASIVIGSGSLPFEMIRSLVERLPVMVTPRWVSVLCQPIAVRDLLDYLVGALDLPAGGGRTYEIGGADRLSYGDLIRLYAELRGLRRRLIPVPIVTPGLSSLWLGLVSPKHYRVGRRLIESLRSTTIADNDRALADFAVRPTGAREALRAALEGN